MLSPGEAGSGSNSGLLMDEALLFCSYRDPNGFVILNGSVDVVDENEDKDEAEYGESYKDEGLYLREKGAERDGG